MKENFPPYYSQNKKFLLLFSYSHPWNDVFFWREIQFPIEIIFAAMNCKKFKDDYSGKFAEIPESAKWSFILWHFMGRQYVNIESIPNGNALQFHSVEIL
jgi:hypothetical protein